MDRKLLVQALVKVSAGILLLCVLIFVPAGTFRYPGGWLLMGVLFIPMVIAGFVMMARAPELLKKRLNMKEREKEQKEVVLWSGVMFIAAFFAAGLSFRLHILMLPWAVSVGAAVVFLIAYTLYAEVLRENEYLSRTVEVQEGQKVIDTGLYGVVRHPMYMATVFIFLMMPLILGSVIGFVIMLFYIPLIVKRIRNEEKVLEEGLAGYREYEKKVRYHLVPFIW
ncbi:MAG: isoprenylcysteine carboxylmethyltransferase family protein [Lachnospiraceae bacterium]|nr:isoprenylcysteine carboxylmethyltransferase family protein [Lachnospiraceae bacterium]